MSHECAALATCRTVSGCVRRQRQIDHIGCATRFSEFLSAARLELPSCVRDGRGARGEALELILVLLLLSIVTAPDSHVPDKHNKRAARTVKSAADVTVERSK